MLKDKIIKLMKSKNKKQNHLMNVLDVGSKQSLSRKILSNSFSTEELFDIMESLDCEIVIFDKKKMEKVFVLEKSDFNNEEESK